MRSSAQPQGGFHHGVMRSPEPHGSVRRPSSIDRAGRSVTSNQLELPYVDPQARFSISYVPGMSEHVVNTGKTLPEAQLKVVLLACEVERLNTLNYNLVKENEILKSQSRKTDREADLETKLAIVLAENEKLNQIVEELHSVYARERESLSNEDYERRINDLLQDLEEWKVKYNKLEGGHHDSHDLKHTIEELHRERELLKEQLGRQGRDLEALRARLNSIQVGPADVKLLQEQITSLKIDNAKYKSELDTMNLKYGNADALQQRLNQYESKLRIILAENDKLNNLLAEKARELHEAQRVKEVVIPRQQGEVAKKAMLSPTHHESDLSASLHRENEDLKRERLGHSETVNRITSENDRLNNLVIELRTENEHLRRSTGDNRRADQLTIQINGLLDENRKLNDALSERNRAHEDLKIRVTQLTSEHDRLNGLIYELRSESERLKKHGEGNLRLDQLTAQTHTLLEENKRLNEALADRLRENDGLRVRIHDLEGHSTVVADLRSKLSLLTSENERLNGLIVEIRAESERLRHVSHDTTRVNELSVQINSLLTENKRLNDLVIERSGETDRLRRRCAELEASSGAISELNSRIIHLSSENENLKRQVHEAAGSGTHRLEALTLQVHTLLDENKRLNDLCLARVTEIDGHKRRITELEASLTGTRNYHNQITLLTSDNERLNHAIHDLRAECDRLKVQLSEAGSGNARISQLTVQITHLLEENKRLNDLVIERTSQIDRLKRMMVELDTANSTVNDLKNKLNILTHDSERLNILIVELRGENEKLKLSSTDTTRINQLTVQIHSLLDENKRLNDLLVARSTEIESYKKRIIEIEAGQHDIHGLRDKLALVTTENQRLNTVVIDIRGECDRLRTQLATAGSSSVKIEQLTVQINSLLNDNKRLNDVLIEKTRETEELRRRLVEADGSSHIIKDLRDKISLLTGDSDRLNTLIVELRRENDSLKLGSSKHEHLSLQINSLLDENRRLNDTLSLKIREHEELRRSHALLEGGNSQINELRARITQLTSENDRLNHALGDRLREIEEHKRKIIEIQASHAGDDLRSKLLLLTQENDRLNHLVHDRVGEVDRLNRTLSEKIREIEDHKRRALELQSHSTGGHDDLRSKLLLLTQENDRLNHLVHDRVGEVDRLNHALNDRVRELEEHKRRAIQIQASTAGQDDLRGKLLLLTQENERLNHALHDRLREIDSLKASVTKLTADNERLAQVKVVEPVHRQEETVKKSASPLRQSSSPMRQSTSFQQVHHSTIEALESQVKFLDGEIHRLTAEVHEKERIIEDLRRREIQGESLRGENERLSRLLNDRTRELEESKRSAPQAAPQVDLRSTLEAEYRNLLNTQIQEVSARFNEERQGYDKRHTESLQRLHELQEKILHLTADNDKNLAALEAAKQEINSWKLKYEQLERQNATHIEGLKAEYERRIRESPTRKGMSQQVQDLEDEKTRLNNEIEKLQHLLKHTQEELESWKKKHSEVELERHHEIEELRHQFDNAKKTNIEAREIQVKFNAERTAYETQILQLQQRIADLEAQVQMISSENERITKLSVARLEELEEFKRHQGAEGSATNLEVIQLRTQIENYKASQHDIQQLAIKYSADKAADQSQIKQLKQVNENYKAEIDKLYALLDQRKSDFVSLTKQNEELLHQYEKLVEETGGKGGHGSVQERLSSLERELHEAEAVRDEFRKQAQRNSVDLTRKNRELVDKLQELDILKMKYEEALANYQALNSRLFERLSVTERR